MNREGMVSHEELSSAPSQFNSVSASLAKHKACAQISSAPYGLNSFARLMVYCFGVALLLLWCHFFACGRICRSGHCR
eukprot:5782478-Amphidinium_carterae.1